MLHQFNWVPRGTEEWHKQTRHVSQTTISLPQKSGVNSGTLEGQVVPVSLVALTCESIHGP